MNDPMGLAIADYFESGKAEDILIETNYTEDERIKPAYFFRTEDDMPQIELKALEISRGRILDVGAAAGCHALWLQERNFDVTALEKSVLAAEVMRKRGIEKVVCRDLFDYKGEKFDTILVLMNGTGIGGTCNGLRKMFAHLKTLLRKDGSILIDSSDIKYLFEEEDGSFWVNLADTSYYGEMEYEVSYQNASTSFKWLFTDFDKLKEIAKEAGLSCKKILDGGHCDYLACLTPVQD